MKKIRIGEETARKNIFFIKTYICRSFVFHLGKNSNVRIAHGQKRGECVRNITLHTATKRQYPRRVKRRDDRCGRRVFTDAPSCRVENDVTVYRIPAVVVFGHGHGESECHR